MAGRTIRGSETSGDLLRVTMFGAFAISQERFTDSETRSSEDALHVESIATIEANLTGRAHRLWLLIAYLIVNHDRGVPPQELIDLLWPEAPSSNPAATLQNNVSRARALLTEAGFLNARDLIKYADGLYRWAPDKAMALDIEDFERNARAIGDTIPADDPVALDRAVKTCQIYQGDFLGAPLDVAWYTNLSVYYRTLYKRVCKATIAALLDAGRLKEAQELCLRASRFEPAAEEFSVLLMQTLILEGDPGAALSHYRSVAAYLSDTYDIQPSPALETQREIAMQELYGRSMDEESIRSFLFDASEDEGAFACSNAVFREIALLRMREMERTGVESHIIAISIDRAAIKNDRRIINAKRVAQILSTTLRSSDPFTKVGSDQFLVLLPGANEANARMVFERIVERFEKVFPRADVAFKVSMVNLRALR